jgi:hypothetical protein
MGCTHVKQNAYQIFMMGRLVWACKGKDEGATGKYIWKVLMMA